MKKNILWNQILVIIIWLTRNQAVWKHSLNLLDNYWFLAWKKFVFLKIKTKILRNKRVLLTETNFNFIVFFIGAEYIYLFGVSIYILM